MVQIKIASVSNNVCEVEHFLNVLFKEFKFTRKIYCKMYLSVTEAFNNAILHGNQLNPDKMVSIEFSQNADNYNIKVSDEGKGFNQHDIPDPTHHTNIRKESGRGIFIMKEYADKVQFFNNGTSVLLTFNK